MDEENFNELTPAETERLAILAEECAEVVHIVGKILRHGYESGPPDEDIDNRELLESELGHVQFIIGFMLLKRDVNRDRINESTDAKAESIKPYLHHN